MLSSVTGLIGRLFIPLAILLGAQFALPYLQLAPPAVTTLLAALPYAAALLAMGIALLFGHGRVFFIALLLIPGYWILSTLPAHAAADPFRGAALYAAVSILLPFNIGLLNLLRERGIVNGHGALRLGLILLQAAAVGWVIVNQEYDLVMLATATYLELKFELPDLQLQLPQLSVAAFALAAAVPAWRLISAPSPLSASMLLVLLGVAVACNQAGIAAVPLAFVSASALILAASLVLHGHEIAYRDDLTGLPGRRALNERLAALGRRYTIAMLDVDHFKRFNDTYGHDVGDQVLKMVADRIRGVRGGGQAYRYGGEEFTIVFAGKDAKQAQPYLEAVREAVADYQLVLRGRDRPAKGRDGRKQRGGGQRQQTVGVTISIGIASRDRQLPQPQDVIKAADQALYRAKQAGRNCLSG